MNHNRFYSVFLEFICVQWLTFACWITNFTLTRCWGWVDHWLSLRWLLFVDKCFVWVEFQSCVWKSLVIRKGTVYKSGSLLFLHWITKSALDNNSFFFGFLNLKWYPQKQDQKLKVAATAIIGINYYQNPMDHTTAII